MGGGADRSGVVAGVVGEHAAGLWRHKEVYELVGLFQILCTGGNAHGVHPRQGTLLGRGVDPLLVHVLMEQDTGGVPGLPDGAARIGERRRRLGGVVPERTDVLLACRGEFDALAEDAPGIGLGFVKVHGSVGGEFAGRIEIDGDGDEQGFLARRHLAAQAVLPEVAVGDTAGAEAMNRAVVCNSLCSPVERDEEPGAALHGAQFHRTAP